MSNSNQPNPKLGLAAVIIFCIVVIVLHGWSKKETREMEANHQTYKQTSIGQQETLSRVRVMELEAQRDIIKAQVELEQAKRHRIVVIPPSGARANPNPYVYQDQKYPNPSAYQDAKY